MKQKGYEQELQRLHKTIQAIDNFIQGKKKPWTGADDWSTHHLQQHQKKTVEKYKAAILSPYFGRVDFSENGEPASKYYIGKTGLDFDDYEVIDWRAPVSSLFYGSNAQKQGYNAPDGHIKGNLELKRRIEIQNQKIIKIQDIVDHRSGDVILSEDANEKFLVDELSKRESPQFQDIIKTIQAQQDQIIRASHNKTMILNGVAGSGKTSIAYHRLAYLLFPGNQTGIKAQNCLIFGPNRLFLSFAQSLLAEIEIDTTVSQYAIDDWMLIRMGFAQKQGEKIKRKYRIDEFALEFLGNPNTPRNLRRRHWRRARLKGDLRLANLLERYVDHLLSEKKIRPKDWTFEQEEDLRISLTISAEEMTYFITGVLQNRGIYRVARNSAHTEFKRTIANQYESAIHDRYETIKQKAAENRENYSEERIADILDRAKQYRNKALNNASYRTKVLRSAEGHFDIHFDKIWPALNARDSYYELLQSETLLQELGHDLLGSKEIATLSKSAIPPDKSVDLEDIAGIFYLHLLMSGDPEIKYDHIIVDEGQDLSSLHYLILKKYSKKNSMTIVGDISQGIFGHRGISSWDEVENVLGREHIQREDIKQNYRSTVENVEFANQVLKNVFKGKALLAKPFIRNGEKPVLSVSKTEDSMYKAVVEDIHKLHSNGTQNIAVIVKTECHCEEVCRQLLGAGLDSFKLLSERDDQFNYEGGVIVIPVALAKGLEFQAVLIPLANEEIYDSRVEYDGRLLYVAITRVLHRLFIYSTEHTTDIISAGKPYLEIVKY